MILLLAIISLFMSIGALYINYKVYRIHNPKPLTEEELKVLEQKILARRLARIKAREERLIIRQQKDTLKRGFTS